MPVFGALTTAHEEFVVLPDPLAPDHLQTAIEESFECHRCGHCCKGDGLVKFGPREADAMAAELGLNRRRFIKQYATLVSPNRWVLHDKFVEVAPGLKEQWCIFLTRDADGLYGCQVNHSKPRQCREFPYKWRNPDSFRTCAGLRALLRRLRQERAGETAGTADSSDH